MDNPQPIRAHNQSRPIRAAHEVSGYPREKQPFEQKPFLYGQRTLLLFVRIRYLFGDSASGWIRDGTAIALATLRLIDFVALVFGVTFKMILTELQS